MKKIIFRAPVQTASGYGVHSRMLLKALDESGKFDITVMSVPWGATPLIYDDTPQMRRIKELSQKFNPQVPLNFDASVQVTIPNEFMKLAPYNVGITAGIETDRVAKVWHDKINENIDLLVVPSVHSARGFTTAIFGDQKGPTQTLLRKPITILPEWVDTSIFNTNPVDAYPLPDAPNFNFIGVGLGLDKADGEDRKNFALLIRWFCEQFRGNQNVGLVLKLHMVNGSPVDFKNVKQRIQFIKAQTGCGQFPKITLIHGRLSDLELAALYKNPKIKAFVTTTHGEGFGLPIIEAAACGLPVLATNWSGQLDFLKIDGKNKFVPFDYKLEPIPPSAVWKDVLEEGTRWANPIETDVKMKMAKVMLSYERPKAWADELAIHVANTFNRSLGDEFALELDRILSGEKVHIRNNRLVKTAPSDKKLDNVTLVAISDVKMPETIHALTQSLNQIGFADAILFTSQQVTLSDSRIRVVKLDTPINSVADYDRFVGKQLHKHISTSHILMVQWDGFVINGSAWNDEFLNYDFVGAPWFWDDVVGNAAMAVQSKKLLEELAKDVYPDVAPYDTQVCRTYRKQLEEAGLKFATSELASTFSVENLPYTGQFGWHGENPFIGQKL